MDASLMRPGRWQTFAPALRVPSVDPLTRDLPGPWIQHQPHRSGPVAQKGKAGMVAAIHEELVA
jgi:hypothetical protein